MNAPSFLNPGMVFAGRYAIVRVLSIGGMGTVYEATHVYTRKRVAIKVMLPDLDADQALQSDFDREMSVTAAIDCPHVVQVLDGGIDADTSTRFLVMEYLEGHNLAETVRLRGRLPAAEVVNLLGQTALALDKTHGVGIVHRDLKPENVFLTQRAGAAHVIVLDFGIAKVVSAETRISRCLGTPLYMSPEQLSLEATLTPAADLYALGQLAFTLLVGHEYWHPESTGLTDPFVLALAIIRGVSAAATTRAAVRGITLAARFDPWFARACAKDPRDRFPSALSQIDALADALDVAKPTERRIVAPPHAPAGRESRPPTVATAKTTPMLTPPPARSGAAPPITSPPAISRSVPSPATTAVRRMATPIASTNDEAVYERLIKVMLPFSSSPAAAERDVREAVRKVCGASPDGTMLEYVVEEVMAGFPKRTASDRAKMCIALIDFCERERRYRTELRSGAVGPSPEPTRRTR